MSSDSLSAPGVGRPSLLSWFLRAGRRDTRREPRAAGPAGETALGRLMRFRRDRLHVAELDARLQRDVGLAPMDAGDIAQRRADIVLRHGGYP